MDYKSKERLNIGDKVTVRAFKDILGKRFIDGDILEVMGIDEVNAKLLSVKAGIYVMNLDFIDKIEEE